MTHTETITDEEFERIMDKDDRDVTEEEYFKMEAYLEKEMEKRYEEGEIDWEALQKHNEESIERYMAWEHKREIPNVIICKTIDISRDYLGMQIIDWKYVTTVDEYGSDPLWERSRQRDITDEDLMAVVKKVRGRIEEVVYRDEMRSTYYPNIHRRLKKLVPVYEQNIKDRLAEIFAKKTDHNYRFELLDVAN